MTGERCEFYTNYIFDMLSCVNTSMGFLFGIYKDQAFSYGMTQFMESLRHKMTKKCDLI